MVAETPDIRPPEGSDGTGVGEGLSRCMVYGFQAEDSDRRIGAAVEWARSVADEINVLPLLRALEVIPGA
jgi:hypothetical protein